MTGRQRIHKTLHFERADRVPILGGWVLGDRHHQALAGCTEEAYWQDPMRYAIEAQRALDVDGMIMVAVPEKPGEYRGGLTKEKFESYKERYRAHH